MISRNLTLFQIKHINWTAVKCIPVSHELIVVIEPVHYVLKFMFDKNHVHRIFNYYSPNIIAREAYK